MAVGDTSAVVAWQPTTEVYAGANITHFMREVGAASLEELWAYGQADITEFYDKLVARLGLPWFTPYQQTLDLSKGIPFARWFVGGSYNASYNCIDRHVQTGRAHAPAIIWEDEKTTTRTLTFEQLLSEVSKLCGALSELGVAKGDRVGIFMPLLPETAIALLAVGRIGAIALPAFSGYGAEALATRLGDAKAKVLLTVDGTHRRGRFVNMKQVADAACAALPSIRHLIVL